MQVQKPDYQNSILNLVNSILHNYGAPHRYTTLPEADEILKKDYRHVVLLVLDGMGVSGSCQQNILWQAEMKTSFSVSEESVHLKNIREIH